MALALPLRYGAGVAGVLLLLDAEYHPERGRDDLAVAEGLADAAAVAIANAQFLAQSREAGVLEERARLARDIHDTLAQGLTGIVVQLGAAQRALDAAPEEATEHIALAQSLARESLAEARRSVWNLRSGALERGDLGDALQKLVARPSPVPSAGTVPETHTTFERRGEPWPLSPAVESALLRVAQEALANAARHAQATHADVVLEYLPEAVRLEVCDDGVGLDAAVRARINTSGPAGGFGLLGMRERIAGLGGTLEICGDAGTRIVAVVPRRSPESEVRGSMP
jgi:signal transduction histidine kinase